MKLDNPLYLVPFYSSLVHQCALGRRFNVSPVKRRELIKVRTSAKVAPLTVTWYSSLNSSCSFETPFVFNREIAIRLIVFCTGQFRRSEEQRARQLSISTRPMASFNIGTQLQRTSLFARFRLSSSVVTPTRLPLLPDADAFPGVFPVGL